GSVFRRHVGSALLASGDWPAAVRTTWGVGGSASRETRAAEHTLEIAVSDYIGAMPFLWAAVADPPSVESDRGVVERGAIALLSNFNPPALDPASDTWLGTYADANAIRRSGLWNVHHVSERYDPRFLDVLERHVLGM